MAPKSNHKGPIVQPPKKQASGLSTAVPPPRMGHPPSAQRGFSGSGAQIEGEAFHEFSLPARSLPLQQLGPIYGSLFIFLPKAYGALQDLAFAYLSDLNSYYSHPHPLHFSHLDLLDFPQTHQAWSLCTCSSIYPVWFSPRLWYSFFHYFSKSQL